MLAVDWSGDKRVESTHRHEKLWVAEVLDGRLLRVEPCSRQGAMRWVRASAAADPRLVVGLDFAFSYPAWFLSEHGFSSAAALWRMVGALPVDRPPFWGWAGSRRPSGVELFRAADRAAGPALSSPFQLAGAGAVGTGSRTGMPHLSALADDGFAVWPFSGAVADRPLVVEIYPRRFTGPVVKSRFLERRRWWEERRPPVDDPMLVAAALSSEDAFDATVSAMAMADMVDRLRRLPTVTDPAIAIEGWIADVALPDQRDGPTHIGDR